MTPARRAAVAVLVLGVLSLAVAGLVRAAGTGEQPSLQERVDAVAATLRCPTCEGLSIEDSTSVLAGGSRAIIEEQLEEGRTPDEIRQYFVERYGQYVLLSPASSGPGLLAWLIPALAVPGAGVLVWRWLHRARSRPGTAADAVGPQMDDDARAALAHFREGRLVPAGSPAGEALRDALLHRIAVGEAGSAAAADPGVVHRADQRLGAAYRRYRVRRDAVPGSGGALPRRLVVAGFVVLVVASAGIAVILGVRDRGAGDVPTGDGPGAVAAATASVPADLLAGTQERPGDPAAWVALGRAYDRDERWPEAVAAYDRALELQPAADDVALLRAGVLVRAGSPAEALPTLQDLAGRYPDNPDVLLILGLAQEGAGAGDATATLRRFLELAPDSPAAPGVRSLLAGR
jgi:cytochrome c-type biogenesis protein CcmH